MTTIYVDTREQRPYGTKGGMAIDLVRRALDVGDYALATDFVSSWLCPSRRKREIAKLRRARELGFGLCYVVDGDESEIRKYNYDRFKGKRKPTPADVFRYIDDLRARGFQVILGRNKRDAARHAFGLLLARARRKSK